MKLGPEGNQPGFWISAVAGGGEQPGSGCRREARAVGWGKKGLLLHTFLCIGPLVNNKTGVWTSNIITHIFNGMFENAVEVNGPSFLIRIHMYQRVNSSPLSGHVTFFSDLWSSWTEVTLKSFAVYNDPYVITTVIQAEELSKKDLVSE